MNGGSASLDFNMPDTLLSLAHINLDSRKYNTRDKRQSKTSVFLEQFAPEDASLVIHLYETIKKTYDLWLTEGDYSPNYDQLREYIISQFGTHQFLASIQAVGAATNALGRYSAALRKVIHDIRGGALTVLAGYVYFLEYEPEHLVADVQKAVLSAHDHAKLMRNAIIDLDPPMRQLDKATIETVGDLIDKWHGSTHYIGEKRAMVEVLSAFAPGERELALTTSTMNHLLYNYINNAARFTTDKKITANVFPAGETALCWVMRNSISRDHESWLNKATDGDFKQLFRGGLTQGGNGIGLSVCADVIADRFGLNTELALDKGYLGAQVANGYYYTWFYWPINKEESY